MNSNLNNACFYSFQKSVILSGEVRNNILYLRAIETFLKKDCEFIADKLKELNNIWIAEHVGLEECLKNLKVDVTKPSIDLVDVWLGLKSENKVIKCFENALSSEEEIIAVQVLLNSLIEHLYKPNKIDLGMFRATVVKRQNEAKTRLSFGRN